MDHIGEPIAVTVEEPLQRLRVTVAPNRAGIEADLVFTGRAAPIEEPRFTRRVGSRTLMDVTRMTQNGAYAGWIAIDGRRHDVGGMLGFGPVEHGDDETFHSDWEKLAFGLTLASIARKAAACDNVDATRASERGGRGGHETCPTAG